MEFLFLKAFLRKQFALMFSYIFGGSYWCDRDGKAGGKQGGSGELVR